MNSFSKVRRYQTKSGMKVLAINTLRLFELDLRTSEIGFSYELANLPS